MNRFQAQKIIDLVQQTKVAEAFAELKALGVSSIELKNLEHEFISGTYRYDHKYYERLHTYINSLVNVESNGTIYNKTPETPPKTFQYVGIGISGLLVMWFVLWVVNNVNLLTYTIGKQKPKRNLPKDAIITTPNGVSFKIILVEGGTFQMGSNGGRDNEKPVHPITLTDYYIAETEVTQELYKDVMDKNPSGHQGAEKPVEQVSWYDAQAFITELNKTVKNPMGVWHLPTEAQWEYAARGGKYSKGYEYAGSNNIDSVAWQERNSSSRTHPVGIKKANELGLYDMSGNVWEWCFDDYEEDAYAIVQKANIINPILINTKPTKFDIDTFANKNRVKNNLNCVLRGGSWHHFEHNCRVTLRYSNPPNTNQNANVGFRLCLFIR